MKKKKKATIDPFAIPKPKPYVMSDKDKTGYFNEAFFTLPQEEQDTIIADLEKKQNEHIIACWEVEEQKRKDSLLDLDKFPKLAEALAKRKARLERG